MPFCTQVTGGTGARGGKRGCQRRTSPHLRGHQPHSPIPFILQTYLLFPFPASSFPPPFPKSLKAHKLICSSSAPVTAPGRLARAPITLSSSQEFKQSFSGGCFQIQPQRIGAEAKGNKKAIGLGGDVWGGREREQEGPHQEGRLVGSGLGGQRRRGWEERLGGPAPIPPHSPGRWDGGGRAMRLGRG